MRFLLVFAAILAMTGGAQAALITYDLTFFADPDGQGTVEWGTGQVSYDPEVKQDIGFNQEGEICINSADPLCQYLATWTPVNISCNLIFAGCGGPAHIFLEGSFITLRTGTHALLQDQWYLRNWMEVGISLDPITGPGQFVWSSTIIGLPAEFGPWQNAGGVGTITAELSEVPLPAAAWLFLAGVGALWFRGRSVATQAKKS